MGDVLRHGVEGWRLEHYEWRGDRRVFFYTNEETAEAARVTIEGGACSVRYGQHAVLDWLVESGADWS